MKDELLENNIVSLHGRGWSMRRLAQEFNISRQRVKRILLTNVNQRKIGIERLQKPESRGSKLDVHKAYIGELLEQYNAPPITNQRIYELLLEKGYEGKMTILRNYLAQVRGKKTSESIVCVETNPGQRGSHDWSEYYIELTDHGGEKEKIIFLSYILNYSRRQYIEIVEDKTQSTLFGCLINAFIYFDGVPKEIKGDNQKVCVDRWELGKPIFNKNYLSFATHYRFRPLTIHPGEPRENLKIERPFYYLETNFLNGRTFCNKQDLQDQLQIWLVERNDQRIHRTTKRKPIDLYGEELASLQRLPTQQYDTSIIEYRIVNNESAIQWENYYYVVPSHFMYESCAVRITKNELIIYSPDYEIIVRYPKAEKGRKNRYIGRKEKVEKYTLPTKQVAERLRAFGPDLEHFMEQIKRQKPGTHRHHWRHILSLKATYRVADIIVAVQRAARYHVYDSRGIENFLAVNAKKISELTFSNKTSSNE